MPESSKPLGFVAANRLHAACKIGTVGVLPCAAGEMRSAPESADQPLVTRHPVTVPAAGPVSVDGLTNLSGWSPGRQDASPGTLLTGRLFGGVGDEFPHALSPITTAAGMTKRRRFMTSETP